MAQLKNTNVDSLSTSKIQSLDSNDALDTSLIDSESRYLRKAKTAYHSGRIDVDTSWRTGSECSTLFTDFKPYSIIQLHYLVPSRNDSESWGGLYIEPQVEYNNNGSWFSLGCTGYDGGVMILRSQTIASYTNSILIHPNQPNTFSVRFRFAMRSYDGTTTINGRNSINTVSGTAPIMSGANGMQHYFHIVVEEYAKWI